MSDTPKSDLLQAAKHLREWAEHIQLYDLLSEQSPFHALTEAMRAKKDALLALADRLAAAPPAPVEPVAALDEMRNPNYYPPISGDTPFALWFADYQKRAGLDQSQATSAYYVGVSAWRAALAAPPQVPTGGTTGVQREAFIDMAKQAVAAGEYRVLEEIGDAQPAAIDAEPVAIVTNNNVPGERMHLIRSAEQWPTLDVGTKLYTDAALAAARLAGWNEAIEAAAQRMERDLGLKAIYIRALQPRSTPDPQFTRSTDSSAEAS